MESLNISNARGSMLVELCVAAAVFSITTLAFTSFVLSINSFANDLETLRQALFLAVSDVEHIRADADTQIYSESITATDNVFSTSRIVKDISPCLRSSNSAVSWDQQGSERNMQFNLFVPDTLFANSVDGDCGELFVFSVPTSTPTISSVFNLEATSTAIDVLNHTAYIVTNKNASSTLAIVDIDTHTQYSSLSLPARVRALDAIHNQVFVVVDYPTQQLIRIDTTSLQNPHVIGQYSLPGVSGTYPGGTAITYFNKKVYIGTHRTAGHEFHIFDVTGPQPLWLGSLELNHNINQIFVREPYAYLATSGNTSDVIVIDIQNPQAPRQIASVSLPGNEDSISLYGIGQTLYVGRKKSTRQSEPDFVILNIKNPFVPLIEGSYIFQKDVAHIFVIDTLAYVLTKNRSSAALSALDISDHTHPTLAFSIDLPDDAETFDAEQNSLYLTSPKLLSALSFSP